MSMLDTLTTDQESLVLDAIEGDLQPDQQSALHELLASKPNLRAEIQRLTATRRQMQSLNAQYEPSVNLSARVLTEVESLVAPLALRHMDAPRRHRRLTIPASTLRPLAAAAAVTIITVLGVSFFRSESKTQSPGPDLASGENAPLPVISIDDPQPTDPQAVAIAQAAAEQRTITLAEDQWIRIARVEPTLDEAAELLAQGRLVIHALASRPELARTSITAMTNGLDSDSTAWSMIGPASRVVAARFDRPAPQLPVFAVDELTGTTVEVPHPRTVAVWSARIDTTPAALASIIHNLRELGLTVRLEAIDQPTEAEPSLEDALWWQAPPSTWQPSATAPIVIDALHRSPRP